jgi:hypothetical protein
MGGSGRADGAVQWSEDFEWRMKFRILVSIRHSMILSFINLVSFMRKRFFLIHAKS